MGHVSKIRYIAFQEIKGTRKNERIIVQEKNKKIAWQANVGETKKERSIIKRDRRIL